MSTLTQNLYDYYQITEPGPGEPDALIRVTRDLNRILGNISNRFGNVDVVDVNQQYVDNARYFTNTRFLDPSAPDQSKSYSDKMTLRRAIDELSRDGTSRKGTIIARHTGVYATTRYSFSESMTIPDWVVVVPEPGILFCDIASSINLTILSYFPALRMQVFDWDGGGNIYFSDGTETTTRRVYTVFPEWWNGSIGDGSTAAQTYFDAAADSYHGVGGEVLAGQGIFKLSATIGADQNNITYRGVGYNFTLGNAPETASALEQGTWFWIEDTGFAAFTISGGGIRIKSVGFAHDQPTPGGGWAPTEYDYTIKINGAEDNISGTNIEISDICLLNSTYGIRLGADGVASTNKVGRITIRDVKGCCFKVGLSLEQVWDFSEFSNLHFVHLWSGNTNVLSYMKANTKLIVFYHADHPHFVGIKGYIGYQGFVYEPHVTGNGAGSISIEGVQLDNFAYGHVVNASAVANGSIVNFSHIGLGNGVTGYTIYDAAAGSFSIDDLRCSTVDGELIKLAGSGAVYQIDNFAGSTYNQGAHAGSAASNCGAGNTIYWGSQRIAVSGGAGSATAPNIFGGAGTNLKDGEGLGAWSASSGAATGTGTLASGTASTDMVICAHLDAQTDGNRGQISIETPSGTVRSKDSVHFDSGVGVRVDWASVTAVAKNGDTWLVALNISAGGGGGNPFNWYVNTIPVSHWKHAYS